MLERLESRRLLAINFASGILTITGTSGDDVIDVYTRPTTGNFDDPHVFVRVNNAAEGDFDWHAITLIRIDALGGNDYVDLHRGGDGDVTGGRDTGKSAHVEGGAGSDTLIGSAGLDTLVGGSHSDALVGNGGDDLLSGGAGNDKLWNVEGVNTVYDGGDTLGGGDGNDTLLGGGGADNFRGGRGIDTVDYSAKTNDLLIVLGSIKLPDLWPVFSDQYSIDPTHYTARPYPDFDPRTLGGCGYLEGDIISDDIENAFGGSGNDCLWGSNTDNILEGRAGNDQLYGSGGFDALYGNDGNDRLFAADDRDGMPTLVPPAPRHERIVGGLGRDYAMLDPTDAAWTSRVEKIETLPYLYS